ncbi:sensor histidine kinase [Chitinophaga sp. 30R24]|uniref:sensor histidine kinase n=1 Tax=Chitinophaga sp. 30R24 TaxID=3248838 RepID=UPI003B917151
MKRSVVWLLHIGYWGLYLCLIIVLFGVALKTYKVLQVLLFPPVLLTCFLPGLLGFYTFYTFLFDNWLKKKRLPGFLGLAVSLAGGVGLITFLLLFLLAGMEHATNIQKWGMCFFLVALAAIHGVIGLVLKGFISWYGDIRLKEDLNKRNYETELALVKSQINPHFLFNTINNIDVLIEKDAKKASLYLNKLSGIMRFMLYEAKPDRIPLAKEMVYIEEYIALQRIRTANRDYVQYTVQGEPGNRMIAPMLFISYIENAFKHAAHKKDGSVVDIRLFIENDCIRFYCENKYQRLSVIDDTCKGLGNELLQRRLALLYPAQHTLDIADKDGIYQVSLILYAYEN